ncbi:MAG: isocitrate lyase/PEP mutase family protein [Dehalococcoidia bacterium]|nr:isocitrate lyase/PEP mutase family protein [Dehalococcoidia bacterium]
MSQARQRFRDVLFRPSCTLAANIFDPLSAHIAHLLEYEVCVLSGSVGKVANLGVPDIVMTNMSDVVDCCRRITRIDPVSLMVDAEDGFGNAVNVRRTVQELEAAGASAIEIEDNVVPKRFNVSHPGLVTTAEQVGKLRSAVAARSDPATVIVARSAALGECPLEEALDRIRAYSDTGAEALMLTGVRGGRSAIEAVHRVTSLPICVLNPPPEARNDLAFLGDNGVRILMLGNPTFAVAVKAVHDALLHLRDGGAMEDLREQQATPELLRAVNRTEEFIQWQREYLRE